jgi:cytochrome b6-f complex iron-sulfur subunit
VVTNPARSVYVESRTHTPPGRPARCFRPDPPPMPGLSHPSASRPSSENLSRRDFVRCACTTGLFIALGASLSACGEQITGVVDPPGGISIDGNTITIDLSHSAVASLRNAGGFVFIGSANVIAINVDGNVIRAFSSACTHEGFPVNAFSGGHMICSAHGSRFNTSGAVVQGPAASPLTEYSVSRNGDQVVITKS